MLFELSIVCKYLIPRWRRLSMSIISLVSVIVISLVVWLILVFFSVSNGMEKMWIEKLVTLSAPVRVTPTPAYYNSHYYKVDTISHMSNYAAKSILDKRSSEDTNPYDPDIDIEVPRHWPSMERDSQGRPLDLVKEAFSAIEDIEGVPGLVAQDYEVTVSTARIQLLRRNEFSSGFDEWSSKSFLTQLSYIASYSEKNPYLDKILFTPHADDISNVLHLLALSGEGVQSDDPNIYASLPRERLIQRVSTFFDTFHITHLSTPKQGWRLPSSFIPEATPLTAYALERDSTMIKLFLLTEGASLDSFKELWEDQGYSFHEGTLLRDATALTFSYGDTSTPITSSLPIVVDGDISCRCEVRKDSFKGIEAISDIQFDITIPTQGEDLSGSIPLASFDIAEYETIASGEDSPWHLTPSSALPYNDFDGDGVLLPKGFRDNGVRLGDRGYLSYYTSTATSVQEQRLPIYVSGFYDPGIVPTGGKLIIANSNITSTIRSEMEIEDSALGNGINVWFKDLAQAPQVKKQIEERLRSKGMDQYWHVETYEEFDFSRDFVRQLRSDKNLFMLIAVIIIIVACSNIISMLILLVNDKRREIGILRAMGASARSIGLIFGICGIALGICGSIIGTVTALATLAHIDVLIGFLSAMQGHEAFSATFYGDTLPSALSYEALSFVLMATGVISLLAGVVPALKASLLQPSTILRDK
jgi:lipoprotein-releasing system permease protein